MVLEKAKVVPLSSSGSAHALPWNLELGAPFLARDPCTFIDATLVQNGQGRSSAPSTEPSQSEPYAPVTQPRALSRLPPNRPRPRLAQSQPPAKAMAAQRSTPPGTFNRPSPPPHLSSSACDEDRRARGYTQSCSSILLSTILPASVPFTCTSSILPFPPLFMVHWRPDSCRSPLIDRRRPPTSALFSTNHTILRRFPPCSLHSLSCLSFEQSI